MIEIKIPQEINKYESKAVGPLTTRQVVCVVLAGILCIAFFKIFKGLIADDALYATCFLIAVPFALIGWYKPYGLPAEKFFIAVLFNTIISSTKRFFKSENIVDVVERKFYTSAVEELNSKKDKKKKEKQIKNKTPKKNNKNYKKETIK